MTFKVVLKSDKRFRFDFGGATDCQQRVEEPIQKPDHLNVHFHHAGLSVIVSNPKTHNLYDI